MLQLKPKASCAIGHPQLHVGVMPALYASCKFVFAVTHASLGSSCATGHPQLVHVSVAPALFASCDFVTI